MNKRNAHQIKDDEIARLRQLLQDERDKPHLQAFADEVARTWLLQEVWNTPPDAWPASLKTAFRRVCEKTPTIAAKWQHDWIEYHKNKQ